jgi:hypothetical protein
MFAVVARGQVEDEVAAAVPGGACGEGDEVAADGGGAGLRVPAAGEGPGGAQQVVRHGRDDQPGGVRGENTGGQVGEGAGVQVGDHLLGDGVVAVLAFCLDQLEGESVNTAWYRQAGNSSSIPSAAFSFSARTRRTISRAVTCSLFFFDANAAYWISAASASEAQQSSCVGSAAPRGPGFLHG